MKIRKIKEVTAAETASDEETEVNVDEVMRKYDRESNTRIWEGVPKMVVTAVMIIFSVYCLYMTLFSVEQAETRLARFLAFVIVIGFLMYPSRKTGHKPNHIPWYDIVLMIAGAGAFLYYSFNTVDILMMGTRIGVLEVVLGVIGIGVLVELCRRCVGIPIIVVVGCLLLYAFYWQTSFSSDLGRALSNIVQKLFYTTSGVIGTPTNVCYTYIVLFITPTSCCSSSSARSLSAPASRISSFPSPTASPAGRAAARRRFPSSPRRCAAWFPALRSATP